MSSTTVHPHARGERPACLGALDRNVGSSPRPWGTRVFRTSQPSRWRFIPTPVGNAHAAAGDGGQKTVHPHARGERIITAALAIATYGSSPRPWGTRQPDHSRKTLAAVHPHARGERKRYAVRLLQSFGSSPRPWGTHAADRPDPLERRFIPTPVGKAPIAGVAFAARSVHPHARGERPTWHGLFLYLFGSSPRPWGTHGHRNQCDDCKRFIPTPVGNATGCRSSGRRATVHPHARGERPAWLSAPASPHGSSPRPWGTR